MADTDKDGAIFISYAWGGGLEHKEWVRQRVVGNLDWHYRVFWDRDSIGFGASIDGAISAALAQRPVLVFCLCDHDYLSAAERVGSGLHRELRMLAQMADEPGVKIVPLILEKLNADRLPEPLAGRVYLNLEPLHSRGLDLGTALLGVADGRSQAEVKIGVNAQVAAFNLRQGVLAYLSQQPLSLWGNGNTHEVTVHRDGLPPEQLLAPQWMWHSNEWNFMLSDETPTFCPTKGRWHWDLSTPSRGMQALGTAVLSAFFPQLTGEDEQRVLCKGGARLASNFFRTVLVSEPFHFDMNDLVTFLINDREGYEVLAKLLDAVHRT
ncbi:toll/interleukin-1 receptor domain-containing protein [Achromobacter sp. NPDC058515]|uniref:toll/interleukin-1 receptor domain-containing protein n=1 Tax=Achromobacter sp. NPDC058515 TaxID=3346533 RepID=UPI00365B58B9